MSGDKQELTRDDLRSRPTITVEQAGAVYGLGRAASYAAVKRGEIPAIRIGRRLVVSTARLLRMLGEEIAYEQAQPTRHLPLQGHFSGPIGAVPDEL